jgi:hypothetical protein
LQLFKVVHLSSLSLSLSLTIAYLTLSWGIVQDEMDIENMVNEVQAVEPMESINEDAPTAEQQKFMSRVAVSRS